LINTGDDLTIGDLIKKTREDNVIEIVDFAKLIGVANPTLIAYERKYNEPSNKIILKLCSLYGEDVFGEYLKYGICEYCGEEFIIMSPIQKFCCNDHKKKYEFENKVINKNKNKNTELSKIAAEARLLGLSYGNYVGKVKTGYMFG